MKAIVSRYNATQVFNFDNLTACISFLNYSNDAGEAFPLGVFDPDTGTMYLMGLEVFGEPDEDLKQRIMKEVEACGYSPKLIISVPGGYRPPGDEDPDFLDSF